jgi:hypothetical protein
MAVSSTRFWLIPPLPPLQQPQPRGREVQFRLGAVLQHSASPIPLFEHEDEHSLSAVANALSCTPLKVGPASVARSTTGLRRRRKHEDDFDAPGEGEPSWPLTRGLKPRAQSLSPFLLRHPALRRTGRDKVEPQFFPLFY